MVQEQSTVFTFFNSKDRTFACASGCDIMAGLSQGSDCELDSMELNVDYLTMEK